MSALGTIEACKVANLILLEGNPLDNLSELRNPFLVFINGRKLERSILNEYVTNARNRDNLLVSVLRYVENLIVEK